MNEKMDEEPERKVGKEGKKKIMMQMEIKKRKWRKKDRGLKRELNS